MYEQKTRFKGVGDGRDGNSSKGFSYLFHFWYYNLVTVFSLCLLSQVYHVEFQFVKKIISGCDFVLTHVYAQTSL